MLSGAALWLIFLLFNRSEAAKIIAGSIEQKDRLEIIFGRLLDDIQKGALKEHLFWDTQTELEANAS